MADETTTSTSEPTTSTSEPKAETTKATAAEQASTGTASTSETSPSGEAVPGATGAGPEGGPVPGDPSSEPVATAQQSHVAGRVGPPTIPQDAAADWYVPEGVTQLAPGTVLPADTAAEGGVVAMAVPDPATMGAGPYGGDTPADEAPSVIKQTTPGTEKPGPDELPAGVPVPSDASGSDGPVTSPPARTSTTAAPDSSGSPTSPTGEPAPSSSSGGTSAASAGTSEPADAAPSAESGADTPGTTAEAPTGSTGTHTGSASDSG